ncbi:MAG TPA: ribosome silencing factor [Terracidiphilus sp.]|nr:ribosome silencing factor [Terracidiphilus sp.]
MTPTQAHEQTSILVQAAARTCEEKKGEDTRILELDAIDSGLADFFLITSATSDRQAIAIADEIELKLKRQFGVLPNSVEGRRVGEWILLDYVDFVVHIFLAERRRFYDIERLRKSARPLSPAEFDAELKAALAARTLAARGKAGAKATTTASKAVVKLGKTAKKSPAGGKAAAGRKPAPKSSATPARGRVASQATRSAAKPKPAR